MSFAGHGKLSVSWWDTDPTGDPVSTTDVWVGHLMGFTVSGRVSGFRVWRGAGENTLRTVQWGGGGAAGDTFIGARHFFPQEDWPADAWQNVWVHPMIRVDPTSNIFFFVGFVTGGYRLVENALIGGPIERNGLLLLSGGSAGDVLTPFSSSVPDLNAYGIDILFLGD